MVLMIGAEPISVRSVFREHAALLVSAGLAALTVVRLAQVAGGDETTAYAILRYVGTAEVVVASVVVLIPYAVAWAVAGLIMHALNQRDFRTYAGWIFITGVTALTITPVVPLVFIAGMCLFFVLAWRRDRAIAQRATTFVLLTLFAPLVTYSRIWLPSEAIEAHGSVHVGYVLDDDDAASLVLLSHDDRQVTRIALTAVESRTFCEIRRSRPGWRNRAFDTSLPGLVQNVPDYPQCPATTSSAEDA